MFNKPILFILLFLQTVFSVQAGKHISGFVKDQQTGEKLIGAYIIEVGTTNATSTDQNGYFSLVISGSDIRASYIGYKVRFLTIDSDTVLTINMESGQELETVNVLGKRIEKFDVATLNAKDIISIPAIGGKPDVIKTLQLLPGIQTQSEGTSLMNVRGGNPGENLYLIDNVPLIYMNHLGGFMSVFNPEMINGVEVYKGGFPPRYGGKLSSVVAISQRDGNTDHIKGSFGIGLTDASVSIEGPINDKLSFIVNGRKTLTDGLYLIVSSLADQDYLVRYGFHDINAKLTYRLDEKNSISANLYQGDDYLHYLNKPKLHKEDGRNELQNIWGNWLASTRWSSTLSPKLYVDNTVSFCRYRLKLAWDYEHKTDSIEFHMENSSSVQDFRLSSDWKYTWNKWWLMDFGLQNSSLMYIPNKYYRSNLNTDNEFEKILTNETAVYLNNKLVMFDLVEANLGGRFVGYFNGKFRDLSFEPRLSIQAQLAKSFAVNLSYQRVKQYSHLIFSAGNILNNEVWVPASERFGPSLSNQYTLGLKGSFYQQMFEYETNLYYKNMLDLATYREGYRNFLGDGGWRSKIEAEGKGISYGAEFLLKKVTGNWTGFASYTYSKTTRQYPGINRGEEFLFDYNRPHSIALTANRKLNERWDFGFSWVYQTGLPYTPVLGRQMAMQQSGYGEALIYGERNSERISDYHRLDLGFTLNTFTKRGRKCQWIFSVYNAYNHKNAYNYVYAYDDKNRYGYWHKPEGESLKLYQQTMFPIIPSVAYKVYFDDVPNMLLEHRSKAKRKPKEPKKIASSSLQGRWNVKFGSTYVSQMQKGFSMYNPVNTLRVNYGLSRFIDAGIFVGHRKYWQFETNLETETYSSFSGNNSLLYGIQTGFHFSQFMPSFSKYADLYINGELGAQRYRKIPGFRPSGTDFRYSVAVGTAIYFSKHLGLYVEYGLRNSVIGFDVDLRYGLSVKF